MDSLSDIDLLIARAEGRLEALRELRQIRAAPARPAVNGHTNGHARQKPSRPLLEPDEDEGDEPRQQSGQITENDRLRARVERQRLEDAARAEQIEKHAARVAVEEPPQERRPARAADRTTGAEWSMIVAAHLLAHGPNSKAALVAGTGISEGGVFSKAVAHHPWFEKDRGQWKLTTAGHQAATGKAEDVEP
jgi:hypothetical protein